MKATAATSFRVWIVAFAGLAALGCLGPEEPKHVKAKELMVVMDAAQERCHRLSIDIYSDWARMIRLGQATRRRMPLNLDPSFRLRRQRAKANLEVVEGMKEQVDIELYSDEVLPAINPLYDAHVELCELVGKRRVKLEEWEDVAGDLRKFYKAQRTAVADVMPISREERQAIFAPFKQLFPRVPARVNELPDPAAEAAKRRRERLKERRAERRRLVEALERAEGRDEEEEYDDYYEEEVVLEDDRMTVDDLVPHGRREDPPRR